MNRGVVRICTECDTEFSVGRRPNAKTCGPECQKQRKLDYSKAWQKAHPEYVKNYQKAYHAQPSVKARKKALRPSNQEVKRQRLARRLKQLLGGK